MAKVYIPGGSTYQNVVTPTQQVTERVQTGTQPAFSFFGIPFGKKPVYTEQTKEVPLRTPVSSYGVNDTGRTYPFNPNPTMPDYRSVDNGKGTGSVSWAGGGASGQSGGGGSAQGGDGLLGGILAMILGKNQPAQSAPYEAALRERPGDVQNLVSMTRKPGFGGGTVDPNSNFNRQRG